MQSYVGALTMLVLGGLVVTRILMLRRRGIQAAHVGSLDKSDFAIPPFALFYFYMIAAHAFGWPSPSAQRFFASEIAAWAGVGLCVLALLLFVWSLISFGRSFRVGIDIDAPDKLVTSGAFAVSRNPIYVGFMLILLGQFLIFPNWILLVYLMAAMGLIHRQILREEDFLRGHYGADYVAYCQRVRRYI